MSLCITYLRWRGGLALGKLVKRIGRTINEAGWKIEDRAARRHYRKIFTVWERRK